MKRSLLISVFIFTCLCSKAQSVFAPVGSTWNYTWHEHTGAYNGPKTLFYTGDTVISSITYKKIASAWNYSCICPNPQIGSSYYDFIYESGDSIFRALTAIPNQLLYAFNQNVGDTIFFGGSGIPYFTIFDSLKTQFICGQNRRVLWYTKYENGCTDSVRIIEGIGPVNDYLFSQGIGACELGPGTFVFDCADITTCIYPNGSCTAVPLSIAANPSSAFSVWQKENSLEITLEQPTAGEINVYDVQGKLILKEKISGQQMQLPLPNSKGIYLVRVNEKCKKIVVN